MALVALHYLGPRGEAAGRLVETALVPVTNPPSVRMLVPGFAVRELPVQLKNINNLACAPDGRLFALGYDGNVFELKDTDGDGLEDTATLFFKNANGEIPPSIGMCWGPGGLYIASRGRVIRLRDRGDGTGELETIATGWVPPTAAAGSGLDSVGVAVDGAGNVFFALGCDAWSSPYRVSQETGRSEYNIRSERGTILKVSPDWQRREVVCTGLRWTVSLAFNAAGDLFCTDQEGATWLANGNPFDELLHIQAGRHYGFPPRHPKYLPGVIDEPSVFDYAPQHQSTCGLHFNEPVAAGGKTFGPGWWRGDAIVSGESRGKIWRTKLVKTATGYVARTDLIACLKMLTIDAVPTTQGDLVVTCHSGEPDWGTGPEGQGKLFKISLTDPVAPQPVLAYAASPTELRVVFDRALGAERVKDLARQCSVTTGKYVSAADRYESIRPGYRVVSDQQNTPRFAVKVVAAEVAADGRSLSLRIPPRAVAMNYALTLPELTNQRGDEEPAMDLLADLTGVEASWRAAEGKDRWSGWLPHLDLTAARGFSVASAEHDRLFAAFSKPGTLRLRTQLNLARMLHPAVQPGAKLDFEYPPETVTIVLKASAVLTVNARASVQKQGDREVRITTSNGSGEWLPLEITLATGAPETTLDVSWFTNEDPRPRALPLRRILLPWAKPTGLEDFRQRLIPEIAGGDWQRGRKVFFSEPASCSKCHQVGGQGGKIGPDLSSLTQRSYASVFKDITQPSAALNPDHIAYNVMLKNGEMVTGVVLSDTAERLVLGQVTGNNLIIPRAEVGEMKASKLSLMPEALWQTLDQRAQRDLLTFLLTPPPGNARN